MSGNIDLAKFLVQQSEKGLQQSFTYDALRKLGFAGSLGDYERAAGKLDHDGFVTANDSTRAITLNPDLYWEFDEPVLGHSPIDDGAALAKLALKALSVMGDKKEGALQAASLHQASGWPLRRFNPAFAYLVEDFAEDAAESGTGDYYAASLTVTAKDIPGLKELAEG